MTRNPANQVSTRTLVLILVIGVGGIVIGTLLTMKFQGPRGADRTTMLGHEPADWTKQGSNEVSKVKELEGKGK